MTDRNRFFFIHAQNFGDVLTIRFEVRDDRELKYALGRNQKNETDGNEALHAGEINI